MLKLDESHLHEGRGLYELHGGSHVSERTHVGEQLGQQIVVQRKGYQSHSRRDQIYDKEDGSQHSLVRNGVKST